MAGYAVMAVEGVLAQSGPRLVASQPIPAGVQLYIALKRHYKIALVTHEDDEEQVDWWLGGQGLQGYTVVVPGSGDESAPIERIEQLKILRGRGFALDLFIDCSPAAVAGGMALGITSLLFSSPRFARPEFRPDARTEVREWSAIEAEMHTQTTLRGRQTTSTADLVE